MKQSITTIFLILFVFPLVYAATFTVTNTNDTGSGSLRQAITDANSAFGPDNIIFNIPTSDSQYNSGTGVWTITPITELPMLTGGYTNIDATTQTTNQGNTNSFGPEIVIDGSNTLQYGLAMVTPNNSVHGIILGQFMYGILIYNNTATQNIVDQCWLGVGPDGQTAFPNDFGVVVNNNATNNFITSCLISGNTTAGIVISEANSVTITGNKIGVNYNSSLALPNGDGIIINEANTNVIGGGLFSERNIISGNTNSGIAINGVLSTGNIVQNNFIGIASDGFTKISNDNGIIIAGASNNVIGGSNSSSRNIISGNMVTGVALNGSGTENNTIKGNYIGMDSTGLGYCDNQIGIALKSNSNKNTIGGAIVGERNIISGNTEMGIYIESSDSNIVTGNYVGPDLSGNDAPTLLNDSLVQGNGIELNTLSKYNTIGGNSATERNVISGNRVYGMTFYGNSSYNNLTGNYIGTTANGNSPLPNVAGICVDGGANNNDINNNLLSGNITYGIFISTTGTYYNSMKGNLVGTNATGTDTVPNDIGLVLSGGAKYNVIGGLNANDRNIFSGNRFGGIEIVDLTTDYNQITGNYIGTDITGVSSIPNGYGLTITTNPKHTEVNNNTISGNTQFGIVLFEYADSNLIEYNYIGTQSDGVSVLGNGKSGILITSGSSSNKIFQNTIANNDSSGVAVIDSTSRFNTISQNSIYDNYGLGIELFPVGPNINDVGDNDSGPNDLMNYPIILTTGYNPGTGQTYITGNLDTQNPQNSTIEIFKAALDTIVNYGEGKIYLGSTTPNSSGSWTIIVTGLVAGDPITATATDPSGNTSEFSQNTTIIVGIEDVDSENSSFVVYPNPTTGKIIVETSGESINAVKVYNLLGNQIYESTDLPMNKLQIAIDLTNHPAGIYFVESITSENIHSTRKINIIK